MQGLLLRLTLLPVLLAPFIASQAGIDFPCDPYSPEPECTAIPHLVCSPLWNHFSDGTCRCEPNTFWHYDTGLDECRIGAHSPCATGEGAPLCTPQSTCHPEDGLCICDPGTHPQTMGGRCVAGYNDICGVGTAQTTQCDVTLKLVCRNPDPVYRNCTCRPSDVWSPTRGKCLGTVETSCSVADDCVDNAVCARSDFGFSRCRCAAGFIRNADGGCSLALGAPCDPSTAAPLKCNMDAHQECSPTNRTCVCADSRLPLPDGSCLGVADHDCEGHGDCGGGALCHTTLKKCFCSQALGFIQLVSRSCGRLGRGGYCRLPGFADCNPSNNPTEYLQCNPLPGTTYGRCECTDGLAMDDSGRCMRLAGETCGEAEFENANCVPNAACIGGHCECLQGTAPTSEGICLKSFDQTCDNIPGNQCNEDLGLSCTTGAGAKCVCAAGHEWDTEREHCATLVSGACDPGSAYCTANATCGVLGFCECAAGYAQRGPNDRRCSPSHGTACHPESTPCNEHQFLSCPVNGGECGCEFPLHQEWDSARGSCVSVLGGRCGPLEEVDGNRELLCVETSVCLVGPNLGRVCACDAEAGMEPDGQGKCRHRNDPTITTTTTTTTTEVPPSTTDGEGDNGALRSSGVGGGLLFFGLIIARLVML